MSLDLTRQHILVAFAALPLLTGCTPVVVVENSSGASSSSSSSATSTTGTGGAGGDGSPATSTTGVGGSPATSTTGAGGTPEPPPDEAVAYQMNAAHTGAQSSSTLTPPLTQRWIAALDGSVSYPLIAGGRVFVTVGLETSAELVALEKDTGAIAWGPVQLGGTHARSHAAYDDGKVFAVNSDGQLRAFDAATGNELWSTNLPGAPGQFFAAPTAAMGTVFVVGADGSETIHAVSEATGAVLWTKTEAAGPYWSSPVVAPQGVYMSCMCEYVCAFDLTIGTSLWKDPMSCGGGAAGNLALFDGRFYVRDEFSGEDPVIDAITGGMVGGFEHGSLAAFHEGRGFFLSFGTLVAREIPSMKQIWSSKGDGSLVSAPIVVNGVVYVGGTSGTVSAIDEHTGAPVWSSNLNLGVGIPAPGFDGSQPVTGLAAGGGALLVPAGYRLVAYW